MATGSVVADPYEGLPHDDKKRWICIYPAYINSRKTIAEGRRLPKAKSVDNPLCTEIRDVLLSQQFNVEMETHKHYSREVAKDQIHSGRVRVQIKDADGTPINENIKTRRELLENVCSLIPKLKSRQSGGAKSGGSESSVGGGGQSGSSGGGGTSKKKKSRRK